MSTPEKRAAYPPEPKRKPRKKEKESCILEIKPYKCKICDNEEEEDFEKKCRSLCLNCKSDFNAFKKRNKEKSIRIAACKFMMEQLSKTRADDVILYSEISTNALDNLSKHTSSIISRLESIEKKLGIHFETKPETVKCVPPDVSFWTD